MAFATVSELLKVGKDGDPALGAPETKALDYAGLRALAAATVGDLNAMGIGRDDRVAIVLPNGPEMAAAFLCVAAGATTAPLNPAYRQEEFEFYIADLKAKA
ncbi:MAG: AMP-binding protein, partial [Tagaea sp.]